ncbi:hypothetical protein [Shimia sp.]|uniref:hypothetical protein n=1 Tax=Shimia sp. TaxID=1954381 RepID=UPI003564862B
MRHTPLLFLIAVLGLSACNSGWNPMNWFGRSTEVAVAAEDEVNPLIPVSNNILARPEAQYAGTPVAIITELKVERVANGALIRAAGVADMQGAFDVRLVPRNDGKPVSGVLTFDLKALQPRHVPRGGSEKSRQIVVAHRMTDQQLQGVRTIRVAARDNARQSRR